MKMRIKLIFSIFIIFSIMNISCSYEKNIETSRESIIKFHSQFNNGQFLEIYNEASEEFRKSTNQTDFVKTFGIIQQKLKTVKNFNELGYGVNTTLSGTFVTIQIETEFLQGNATEEFIFVIRDKKALLYNHRIESPFFD